MTTEIDEVASDDGGGGKYSSRFFAWWRRGGKSAAIRSNAVANKGDEGGKYSNEPLLVSSGDLNQVVSLISMNMLVSFRLTKTYSGTCC